MILNFIWHDAENAWWGLSSYVTTFYLNFIYRKYKLWLKCPFINYFQILWVQAKLADETKREAERKATMEARKQAAMEAEKGAAVAEAEKREVKEANETSKRVTSGGTQQAAGDSTDTSSVSNAENKEYGNSFLLHLWYIFSMPLLVFDVFLFVNI